MNLDEELKFIANGVADNIVGSYDLIDIWSGFIFASLSSILVLRSYYGINFLTIIKLKDIFYWMTGVFVFMRSGMFIVNQISFLEDLKYVDAVLMGIFAGSINTYLYVSNYKFITKIFKKYLKEDIEVKNIISETLKTKTEIHNKLKGLSNERDYKPIISIAEISNGGGVPKPNKPLYSRVSYSTNLLADNLFKSKLMLTNMLVYKINELQLNGYVEIRFNELDMPILKRFSKNLNINSNYGFKIGTEKGIKTHVLVVSISGDSLEEKDRLIFESTAKELKNIINKSKKWHQQKIE